MKKNGVAYENPTTGMGFGFEPRGRISPFFECANAAGAHSYKRHLNSYMAWSYGTGAEEHYRALHEAATLADVHSLHVIQVQGPDALVFVDHLVTRNVLKMKVGRSSYVFVCDEDGWILADPVMLILDEQTVWMTVGTVALELWVRGAAAFSDHDVRVQAVPAPSVQVAGPKACEILRQLTAAPLSDMKPFQCMRATLAGLEVVVSTTGYSGERSFEIYLVGAEPYPRGRHLGNQLWGAIRDAGRPHGLLEGPVQYERAREGGMITISHTEGDRINALEFWRGSVVDFDKGDFIGRKALERIRDAGGPPRKMVGLVATEPNIRIETGEWDMPIYDGERMIGSTRHCSWSRHLQRGIAIALIDRAEAVVGRICTLPHATGVADMEVVELPFVRSKNDAKETSAQSVS
ncbi:MAG: aminomethyltransferase family protein [Pseudomonadota bacterium]